MVRKLRLKCDGTRGETRFHLSSKRTSPFKSAGTSVQSTTGSRGVRISSSNAGYTMFRGSVKDNGYPLHSPVSHSLPLPCVTACHHISSGLYLNASQRAQSSRPLTQIVIELLADFLIIQRIFLSRKYLQYSLKLLAPFYSTARQRRHSAY